ncbi:MAG: GNAT family N-acetyltransferase [Alphaproteobacteria bacterium HGW-Alphaproteobacteria-16]|nr:MAG: GNAT family N-acetyltransferase [Alphaproteobacteria bacterium HGW-Alphaproteobacteria-16]
MAGWRAMTVADLPAVATISAKVHGSYAEDEAVYAERLALWPQGCFVWDMAGDVQGLLVTHPWRGGSPPALGAMLGNIPADADTLYLHDLALLPETRGQGAGGAATGLVMALAAKLGFPDVTLVAVNGAEQFWQRQGFSVEAGGGYGSGTYLMRRRVG